MASKRTQDLIPLCHQVNLDYSKVWFEWNDATHIVRVLCHVQVTDKTGCEMEAIVGALIASATIYDMCKGVYKSIIIKDCLLLRKIGGKSGDYHYD
jgi:cyclic pyranopterin monophosphate synthase